MYQLAIMLQHLIIQFFSIISQVVTYWKLKTKENLPLLALKSGCGYLRNVVAYKRLGSKYSDLTWKLLVFWETGRKGEVVAYEGLGAYCI